MEDELVSKRKEAVKVDNKMNEEIDRKDVILLNNRLDFDFDIYVRIVINVIVYVVNLGI